MSANEHIFYFVRYPLGGGGTHLSNLISLSENINKKIENVSATDYFLYLKDIYTNNEKHLHDDQQFIISDIDQWKSKLLKTNYKLSGSVYTGHAASFTWAKSIIDHLRIKKYISITFDSEESEKILSDREYKLFDTHTLRNSYYKEEMRFFYNQEFISDSILCNDDINLKFEITDIFSKNISPVIKKINQKYNIGIPEDQAQALHNLWIKKI